jgi:hypothetical protein
LAITASCRFLRDRFSPLKDLPAWGSSSWYGSWLRLNFGKPHLVIVESPKGTNARRKGAREVHVVGAHNFSLDMCRWRILDGKRRRFHSDQSRMFLLRAGAFLEGRTLLGISLAVRPLEFQLRFEGDATLVVKPYNRAPHSDPLWHLYTGDQYLGLVAGRRLFYRRLSKSPLRSVAAAPVDVAF